MNDRAPDTARITELLLAVSDGGRDALDQLVPLVYNDLRRVAAAQLRREASGHSPQPTALVHEAHVRLRMKGIIMTTHRARVAATLAGLAGLILGMTVAVMLIAQPAAQSGDRRKVIRPEKTPNTGLPYSPGILVGDTLYLSGNLGRSPVTAELVRGGIEAETRQALANMREVLRAAGMDFRDVASVTVYITSFDDFAKFNVVYREFFPKDPPARATVQVAALNVGARIELQMIAAK